VGEKLRILSAVDDAREEEMGALLRTEGVHEDDLALWRTELREVLSAQKAAVRKLAIELATAQRELQEARALLVLQKKVEELFGRQAAESATTPKSEKPSKP
jgi:hypothetical protein